MFLSHLLPSGLSGSTRRQNIVSRGDYGQKIHVSLHASYQSLYTSNVRLNYFHFSLKHYSQIIEEQSQRHLRM